MRHILIIRGDRQRSAAIDVITKLPVGWSVEFRAPNRSLQQNARMWSMLHDLSRQLSWGGKHRSPDDWKLIMMAGLGMEMETAPSIDGNGFVQIGTSSSALTVGQMRDLMDLMSAFGAEHGVKFKAETEAHARHMPNT